MKQSWTKVIILIILAAVFLATAVELLLRNIPNDYAYKSQYMDEHADEIETLILGSSHALFGLDPGYFEGKAFNAGHVSQSLDLDFEIFLKYKERLKNLKTIVIPISYFTLFAKMEAGPAPWRLKNYVIYYELDVASSWADHLEVLNMGGDGGQKLRSYYLHGNSNLSCTSSGWGTKCRSKNTGDIHESGKNAAMRHTREDIHSDKYKEIFKENMLILDLLMEWAGENNVQVLLFTPPAHGAYRQYLNREQLSISLQNTADICSRHDHCSYLNMLADTNFVDADFFDADHLSASGAKKLSLMIDAHVGKSH